MSESEKSQDLSDSIAKLQPKVDFCLFCDGTGKTYDNTVLLRWETCAHCQGKGQ